jgi:diacylglycerol O-acyltransferase / wax synthase
VPCPSFCPQQVLATGRLEEIARRTRVVKDSGRGASAAVLEPLFAVLSRLRVVRWYIARQRQVNTFVTNLRGPADPLALMGAVVVDVIPVNAIAGNVAVAFGAMSYVGTLTITVVADPEVCTDVQRLAEQLQAAFDQLTG